MSEWKQKTSKETLLFLEKVQKNKYSPIEEYLTPTSSLTDYSTDPVTGAVPAILPLRISTADSDGIRSTFTLLVNPENINHGRTQAIYSTYTRIGYVTQMWGPNQDLLTSTGKTAAFMTRPGGLSKMARASFAYHSFTALIAAYRNNGYEFYDAANIQTPLTRVINTVHGVEIEYDGQIFMGHFNNFTIDDSGAGPYNLSYSFEFVVSTLSNVYEQVRGHFTPIKRAPTAEESRLVNEQFVGPVRPDPALERPF